MNTSTDLNAQIAQRIFGWRRETVNPIWEETWRDARNDYASEVPAYTTDPAATAQVWGWLEGRPAPLSDVYMSYGEGKCPWVFCVASLAGRSANAQSGEGSGATWQEALCRAALALAEALAHALEEETA